MCSWSHQIPLHGMTGNAPGFDLLFLGFKFAVAVAQRTNYYCVCSSSCYVTFEIVCFAKPIDCKLYPCARPVLKYRLIIPPVNCHCLPSFWPVGLLNPNKQSVRVRDSWQKVVEIFELLRICLRLQVQLIHIVNIVNVSCFFVLVLFAVDIHVFVLLFGLILPLYQSVIVMLPINKSKW